MEGLKEWFAALTPQLWWALGASAAALALLIALIVTLARRKRRARPHAPGLAFANVHNIGSRAEQQDAFCVSNVGDAGLVKRRGVLMMVADGMGGMSDGAAFSAIVQSVFLGGFSSEHQLPDDPAVALALLANNANNRVLNRIAESGVSGGSTVVAAVIRGGALYFVSAGDSRICLIRGGGVITLNREQSYGVELDDKAAAGSVSWSEAMGDKQRRALTSYIGTRDMKLDRSIGPVRLVPGDRVILMSDGVFGTLSDGELAALMSGDVYASAAAVEAAVLAAAKPAQDNFTAIILEYN